MNILQKLNLSNSNPIRPPLPPSSQYLDHIFEEEEEEEGGGDRKDGGRKKEESGGVKEAGGRRRVMGGRREEKIEGGKEEDIEGIRRLEGRRMTGGRKEEEEEVDAGGGNMMGRGGERREELGRGWEEKKGKRIKMCEHKEEVGSKVKEFMEETERKKKRFSGGFKEMNNLKERRCFLAEYDNEHSKKEVSPQALPDSKIWKALLNTFGLNSSDFSRQARQEKFDSLPKPFNEFNVWKVFNDERYVNGKIERLAVFMKDFEVFYDVVKAELMDFSGEIIGSFPRELFIEDCNQVNKDIYNDDTDDFSLVNFSKGSKIILKKNVIFSLINVTVFSPVENLFYLNICENNIEFFIS